jgi:carboxylesterase type B
MFGTVANESVEFIYGALFFPLPDELGWHIAYDVVIDALFGWGDRAQKVREFYGPPPTKDDSDVRAALTVIITDYVFYCPNWYVGKYLTKTTPTYMWYFDQLPSYSKVVYEKYMPYCVDNICHADDLAFIFRPFNATPLPPNYVPPQPSAAEVQLTLTMQRAWGNFARTGDVNTPRALPVHWGRFDGAVNNLINYSTPVVAMTNGYRSNVCEFFEREIGFYQV